MVSGSAIDNFISAATDLLESKAASRQLRSLQVLSPSKLIDLTHNDYLGLRVNKKFQAKAHLTAADWPMGAGASRLLGGEYSVYRQVETEFARWLQADSALLFGSGYAANQALIGALAQLETSFFSDELNHASIIDGMRLAGLDKTRKKIFPHNDLNALRILLRESTAQIKVVVVESIYSMDGDTCPLVELSRLCREEAALLVVDESHAIGVFGPQGRGWMAQCHIDPKSFLGVYPCGKAMASAGAFVCGPAELRQLLINFSRNFIYSTGPSPWLAAGLSVSIQAIQQAQDERKRLQEISARTHDKLNRLGFDRGTGRSHIIPVILGSEANALYAENFCLQRGLAVRAIRPPTVKAGASRLRLSLHAGLTPADETKIEEIFTELSHAMVKNICDGHRD